MTQKKNIKDYLHLYLPYNIKCQTPNGIGTLCTYGVLGCFGFGMSPGFKQFTPDHDIKPILRPLSDITGKEKEEGIQLKLDKWGNYTMESMAELTRWLLSKHFDLFNLITEGLAIDKTTLK